MCLNMVTGEPPNLEISYGASGVDSMHSDPYNNVLQSTQHHDAAETMCACDTKRTFPKPNTRHSPVSIHHSVGVLMTYFQPFIVSNGCLYPRLRSHSCQESPLCKQLNHLDIKVPRGDSIPSSVDALRPYFNTPRVLFSQSSKLAYGYTSNLQQETRSKNRENPIIWLEASMIFQ